MGRVIAITNQKGGVGKATTTINLGAAIAEKRIYTLLVDSDPQGTLSVSLGLPRMRLNSRFTASSRTSTSQSMPRPITSDLISTWFPPTSISPAPSFSSSR